MQVPIILHSCLDIGDDVKAIENWANIFVHPKKLAETVSKNVLLHRKDIKEVFG